MCGLLLFGCSDKYDDSALRNDLNDLENRVAKLEELCKQMNTNISSLQTIVTALQNNDYVTGVTPVIHDGEEIGYTITFNKSNPITIYHGENGQDTTPNISVKQDIDEIYYWVLNGNWLTDDQGNKIQASDTSPIFKIEEGKWMISIDDGISWKDIRDSMNDSYFVEFEEDELAVYLIFSDGSSITIPKEIPLQILFKETTDIGIIPGGQTSIEYEIKGAIDEPTIKCICVNDWKSTITKDTKISGKIQVYAPNPLTLDEILVLVSDGSGKMVMSALNFVTGKLIPSKTAYALPIDGGEISIMVSTNLQYNIEIPTSDQSWISVVDNRTRTMRTDIVRFEIAANTGITRHAYISFKSEDGKELSSVSIVQEGNEPQLSVALSDITCEYNQYLTTIDIISNTNWRISTSETWYTVTPSKGSKNATVNVQVSENKTNDNRSANIVIQTEDGTLSHTISVHQQKPPYYYLIATANDLELFRNKVNSGYNNINGRLIANITLSDSWIPIGTETFPYSGVFDGNGYSISNISVDNTATAGFFAITKNSKIHDLTVAGSITSTGSMGGLVGHAISTIIDRCKSDMTLRGTMECGGLVGELEASVITNCAVHGHIIANRNIGGIAYLNTQESVIQNSYSASQIYSYDGDVGGLVYYNSGILENSVCSNIITILHAGMSDGAVVGYNHSTGVVKYSYFMKQAPINSTLNAFGQLNWGENAYVGYFNAYGMLNRPVIINKITYSSLEAVLNAWVEYYQDGDSVYQRWDGWHFRE